MLSTANFRRYDAKDLYQQLVDLNANAPSARRSVLSDAEHYFTICRINYVFFSRYAKET